MAGGRTTRDAGGPWTLALSMPASSRIAGPVQGRGSGCQAFPRQPPRPPSGLELTALSCGRRNPSGKQGRMNPIPGVTDGMSNSLSPDKRRMRLALSGFVVTELQ